MIRHFRISGTVQGVGFRPFVYRLATDLGLSGWVRNDARGVLTCVEGSRDAIEGFARRVVGDAPLAARGLAVGIADAECETTQVRGGRESGFQILPSSGDDLPEPVIPPDLAICEDCARELRDPADRRHRYPFINCTHCGPRYSIIRKLPYDRAHTTMAGFEMCPECAAEYGDPANRRFHAQPVACPKCGPKLTALEPDGTPVALEDDALSLAVEAVRAGRILALKGLGGYQLIVDAENDQAVRRLRERKRRPAKPFALMMPDMATVEGFCQVGAAERALLTGPEAPIVLLGRLGGRDEISSIVAPGNPSLGVMLPSTPLHILLMDAIARPVVATSGNLSEEPICVNEDEALARLGGIADLFLAHDRPIERPVDDSVARVVAGRPTVLRAARGYAPVRIDAPSTDRVLLCVGGHLKNAVSVARGGKIVLSQHIGDLENAETEEAFHRTRDSLCRLFDVQPDAIVCDAHPDYVSTRFAESMGLPVLHVPHHYAHVMGVVAEHGLVDETVLGVSWDGTGYGTDGTIWGGEFLLARGPAFQRVGRLRPFRLPGGEAAVREPWRTAMGVLHEIWGDGLEGRDDVRELLGKSESDWRMTCAMLRKEVNSPVTTSAGRLFDALGALVLGQGEVTFEAQAAMALEFAATGNTSVGEYAISIGNREPEAVISLRPDSGGESDFAIAPRLLEADWRALVEGALGDHLAGISENEIAARIHAALADAIVAVAAVFPGAPVVLTGGCMQNRLLIETVIERLQAAGRRVFWQERTPVNDGGLAAGQALAGILARPPCRRSSVSPASSR